MEENNKIFYNPGDLVQLRHDALKSPVMYVVEKVTLMYRKDKSTGSAFGGIRCRWFDRNLVLREAVFSTKDLKALN